MALEDAQQLMIVFNDWDEETISTVAGFLIHHTECILSLLRWTGREGGGEGDVQIN